MYAPAIRWGILGAGAIARTFADAITNHTQSTLAAVGARELARAEAFSQEFGAEKAHGSYEELAADSDIDAIYVATPHSHHHDHALIAIAGGKHILVEKSFTRNAREANAVFDAAEEAGVFCMEAMLTRFLPSMQGIKRVVDSGEIGRVILVEADLGQPIAHVARMKDRELAGGALLDLGVYAISFAHYILGVPNTVTAVGQLTDEGVDGQVAMVLDYGDEGQAVLHTTMWARTPCRAVIAGTKGRIEIDGGFPVPTSYRVILQTGESREIDGRAENWLQYEAAEVARRIAVKSTQSDVLTREDTVAIMRTMDEVRAHIGVVFPGE